MLAGDGDRHAGVWPQGDGPIDLARGRIERVDRLGMPDEELLHAAVLDHGRAAVPWLGRGQGPPDLAAGRLVERHRDAPLADDDAVEQLAVDERVRGEAPPRG